MSEAKTRLLVLFGGRSAEHDVSRVTAAHVLRAVDPARYEVTVVAIDRAGRWVLAEAAMAALAGGSEALPDALAARGPEVGALALLGGGAGLAASSPPATGPLVVLPLLHGPFGEDGTVQGLLEMAGMPYVGAGVLASALAMDKAKAKEVLGHHGIPQAAFLAFRDDEVPSDLADVVGSRLGFPCFTKPSNMGSSVGVAKVQGPGDLAAAVEVALSYDEWLVVEEAIEGREIEIAVLGNRAPRASLPGEVVPGADFYDYEDKYVDGRAKLLVPAPLDAATTERFQQLALRAFAALRAEGMARIDFFLEEGDRARGPLLNEVNTIPGFTPISMYPKLWQASGLAYSALIDELVRLALERWERRGAHHRTDRG